MKSPPLASCLTYFNSRPSARGDLRFEEPGDGRGISIHAPPRGATSRQRMYWRRLSISIHAPPRGATGCKQGLISLYERISIHAPPRGATSRKLWLLKVQKISIHAPPRGATNPRAEKKGVSPYFNSRPSARGDQRLLHCGRGYQISIHAPPRGATLHRRAGRHERRYFNSRPSARGDKRCLLAIE